MTPKPCPFCGNTNEIEPCEKLTLWRTPNGEIREHTSWAIGCMFCGAQISGYVSKESIVRRWNYRWYEHHDKSEWEQA